MNNLDYEIELFDDLSYPVTTSNPFEMNSAGYMVLPHIHSRMELMKVINGPVYVTVGVERYICNKGDIIFVPSNTLHEVTAAEQGKLLKGLIFEYEPFNFNFTNYKYDVLLENGKVQNHIIKEGNEFYGEIDNYFERAYAAHRNMSDTYNLEISAYILLLLSALIKVYIHDIKKTADSKYLRIQPVLDYINEHYNEKIYISSLSKIINLCDDYFIKLFKDTMKVSPLQYITKVRIHQAMILLSSSELSIADIAERTGFSSYEHFCRMFKQNNNITPFAYRNKSISWGSMIK